MCRSWVSESVTERLLHHKKSFQRVTMMLHWVLLALLLGSGACASAGQKEKKLEQKKEPHPLSRGGESLFVFARMAAWCEQREEFMWLLLSLFLSFLCFFLLWLFRSVKVRSVWTVQRPSRFTCAACFGLTGWGDDISWVESYEDGLSEMKKR